MQIPRFPLISLVVGGLLVITGCQSRAPASQLSPDHQLNAFLEELRHDLEGHNWNDILGAADTAHHHVQVTEHGMPEPQYVAELFGLHGVDNNIRTGPSVTWSDLERIETVQFDQLTREEDRYTLTGEVRLAKRETLRLRAWIVQEQGRFRLTGAVG